MNERQNNLVKIGALWKKTSSAGKIYYSGVIELLGEPLQVQVHVNANKQNENHPDLTINRVVEKKQSAAQPAAQTSGGNQGNELFGNEQCPY
jgi:uncharacterized protein (DUF736 family)